MILPFVLVHTEALKFTKLKHTVKYFVPIIAGTNVWAIQIDSERLDIELLFCINYVVVISSKIDDSISFLLKSEKNAKHLRVWLRCKTSIRKDD